MLISNRLIKKAALLSLLAFVVATAGLPLIHPFFHHHCEKHLHVAVCNNLHPGFSNDKGPLEKYKRHCHCPICPFLQHFHINKVASSSLPDHRQCLSELNFLLKTLFVKQGELTDLLPRAPPLLTA